METMSFPFGTELCRDTDTILSIIWEDYQKFCIQEFKKDVEIIKAECIPEDRVLSSFSPAVTEAFAGQFVTIIFQEEYHQPRYECVDYYWGNMEKLLESNPRATWMLSIKEQVRQSYPPSYFTQTLKKVGERWRHEWEMTLIRKQKYDELLEERRITWRHYQMNRLFG
jgi:hypothetical protein